MKESDYIQTNNILAYQEKQLGGIDFNTSQLDSCISESEELLRYLGYGKEVDKAAQEAHESNRAWKPEGSLVLPDWQQLCNDANSSLDGNVESITQLFTPEELVANSRYAEKLNKDFNDVHRLDSYDITLSALAGIISGAVDILFVGVPGPATGGGTLSNHIRSYFEKKFPTEQMEALGREKFVKTPYDAQDNRHTTEYVEGLSSYYHRALSFGHDPLLGFFVGIFDIMTGRMTTLDKSGRFVSQVMENYADRRELNIFTALAKHILHLKSDLTMSMGLPAPLSILFNYCQFDSVVQEDKTIAEIAQEMYYEGYDFIQFCSSSIPVMLTEVIVRIGWALKRRKEGHSLKECIPVSLDRQKNPKLATMLFIAHSAATAINAGKVAFTENPMAINYPQWLAFAKYSFFQLKWNLYTKPAVRHKYVTDRLDAELDDILAAIDNDYQHYSNSATPSDEVIIL